MKLEPMHMETHYPDIVTDGGPWADHDMACPVYYLSKPAVLDLNTGVFHPSWKAQDQGWRLVKITNRFQRFCLWISGVGSGE